MDRWRKVRNGEVAAAEALEKRTLLTAIWTGEGITRNWSDPINWRADTPTGAHRLPMLDEGVVFGDAGVQLAPFYDLGAGFRVGSITISGLRAYTLEGSTAFALGVGGAGVVVLAPQQHIMRMVLSAPGGALNFNIGAFGSLRVQSPGLIAGAANLNKNGTGLLSIPGDFLGIRRTVNVIQGTLKVSGRSGVAAGVGVANGAMLVLAGLDDPSAPLTLDVVSLNIRGPGDGLGPFGAALLASSGTNVVLGPINLTGDTTIRSNNASLNLPTSINNAGFALSLATHFEGNGPTPRIEVGTGGAGIISGAGRLDVLGDGAGAEVVLGGTAQSTYNGVTRILDNGVLVARKPSALGAVTAGTEIRDFGRLQLDGRLEMLDEPLSIFAGTAPVPALHGSTAGTSTWNGPITLRANSVLIGGGLVLAGTVDTNDGRTLLTSGDVRITGVITGSGAVSAGFTFHGFSVAGFLTLEAVNTFTGLTSAVRGTLRVTGSTVGSVQVGQGTDAATIEGTGRMGSLTVGAMGIVAPGVGGPGRLTVNGTVMFAPGSRLRVELNGPAAGTQFDQLRVSGGVALGALGNGPILEGMALPSPVGATFLIIDNTGVGGRFGTFSTAAVTMSGQTFNVEFPSNDVNLRHVNTPATFPGRMITGVVQEGSEAVLTGTIGDPDLLDTFFLEVDWGDGTGTQTIRIQPNQPRQVEVRHTYVDNAPGGGPYAVHLVWHDQNSGQNSDTLSVQVNNEIPVVDAIGHQTLGHNGQLNRQGSFVDPGNDTWTATVDYGDGSGLQALALHGSSSGGGFHLQHRYQQDGVYQVHLNVSDDDGGVGQSSFTVRVGDPPPAPPVLAGGWSLDSGAPSDRPDPHQPTTIEDGPAPLWALGRRQRLGNSPRIVSDFLARR